MTKVPLYDPIYQLNFVLWTLQELPPASPFRPLLKELGYALDSIGTSLPLSPKQLQATAGIECRQAPAPDVIAYRKKTKEYLVIECKKAGFDPGSENSSQARALILASSDLRGPLALAPSNNVKAVVCYLSEEAQIARLAKTLQALQAELAQKSLLVGSFTVLGLSEKPDGVYLINKQPAGALAADTEMAIGDGVKIHSFSDQGEWRLLYFIPWDPSVTQTTEEGDFCKRIFYERILSQAISWAGRLNGREDGRLDLEGLLSTATSNLSKRWRDRGLVNNIISEIRRFLESTLAKGVPQLTRKWEGESKTLLITINSREDVTALRSALEAAKPLSWLASPEARQPDLFNAD